MESQFKDNSSLGFGTGGGFVLDDYDNNSILVNDYSVLLHSLGFGQVSPDHAANDTPNVLAITGAFPLGNYATSMSVDYQFQTYLVFRAWTGQNVGAWIAIGAISWEFKGAAVFNDQGTAPQDYADPANWTPLGLSPPNDGTEFGSATYSLPLWNDYASRIKAAAGLD